MEQILIDPQKTYQTIESFGVSGAWWAQEIGGWEEPDEESGLPKRERIAELLFDREKGIGVSCYRYNLGAGSKQSGKGSTAPPAAAPKALTATAARMTGDATKMPFGCCGRQ